MPAQPLCQICLAKHANQCNYTRYRRWPREAAGARVHGERVARARSQVAHREPGRCLHPGIRGSPQDKVLCVPNAPRDEDWRSAVTAVRGNEGIDRTKTWDRLVLPQDKKDQLKRAARILREADRYKGARVSVPNILLFGPPGTGKTDIARTFANEGGVKFIARGHGGSEGAVHGPVGAPGARALRPRPRERSLRALHR